MALVDYGGGIVRVSGSIAGNTFSLSQEAHNIRSKTKPADKNTARQQKIRSIFTYLANRWSQTLTDQQRTDWGTYGSNVTLKNRLDEAVHVSGYHHYLRSNVIRMQSELSPVDAGPVVMTIPAADPTLAVKSDEWSQELYIEFDDTMDWANENGGYMFVFQGRPMTHQTNFFRGTWRICDYIEGNAVAAPSSPDPQPVVFGIAEDQNQFIFARISRADGRLSEQFFSDCFRGESYGTGYDNFMGRGYRGYPRRFQAV